jgi:diguanylate cyclase (GGDEF)-like protein/PAS domain S-box-containing protein
MLERMPQDDFSTLFELLPIGAYRSSPEGKQLRANAALLRLDGYATEAEMLAATQDLAQEWYVDPARRAQFKAELTAHGRVVDFDSEVYRHKTRERIWVRVHAHVVRDEAGQIRYYEGTVQDITQERSSRMALLASERRFRAIAEKAQLLTVIFDANGLLSYASPAAQTLLGFAPSAMLGSHFLDWVHPDDVPGAREEIARILRFENSGTESVIRMRHGDGGWRHIALLANNCLADAAVRGVVATGRDVTEAQLTQQSLRQSEARFRSLTEMSSDWYWETDAEFRLVSLQSGPSADARLRRDVTLGRTRKELPGTSLSEAEWDAHHALLGERQSFRNFEFGREIEGRQYWISLSGEPRYDEHGSFHGHCGIGRDVTELKRAEDTVRHLAFHDPLTGLANRRLLLDRLQQALAASERHRRPAALLFLDLDQFKQLNDRQGHDAGDQVLVQVAQRLNGCVRAVDTVARMGGDEFVVLLQDLGDSLAQATAQVRTLGHKLLASLAEPYALTRHQHQGGASIGAVVIDDPTQSAELWLKRADKAMYQAKAAGRGTIRFYQPVA